MPWKRGEELKVKRSMPMNVLGGSARNKRVGKLAGFDRFMNDDDMA